MKTNILFCLTLLMAGMSAFAEGSPPLVRVHAELDRGVLPAGQVLTTVVKLTLETAEVPRDAERPPVNLCIVLDRSGSMSGDAIVHAREAAIEAVNRLGPNDVFSLVTYDSVVETLIPAAPLRDKDEARQIIRNISPRGMTALFGGVSQGAAEMRRHLDTPEGDYVHRMILLSDGLANVGPSSPEELGRLGMSLAKEGISITTVGLGSSYNEALMTRLARSSDGNTYYVRNSRDLPEIFSEELGDVLSVAARGVRIRIECPPHVRPVRTIGREATIRGQTVELRMNQLYGGQERFLLLELEVPLGTPDQEISLMEASVSYDNLFTQHRESQETRLVARYSGSSEEVRQHLNTAVIRDVNVNVSADARLRAVELYDQGDRAGAATFLAAEAGRLEQASADYDLPDLERESEVLRRDVQRMGRSLTEEDRKEIQTEAVQESMQQRYRGKLR